jgi:hypothetical protein
VARTGKERFNLAFAYKPDNAGVLGVSPEAAPEATRNLKSGVPAKSIPPAKAAMSAP